MTYVVDYNFLKKLLMKKLSSESLYSVSFAGLFIGPVILAAFIYFTFTPDASHATLVVMYAAVIALFVWQLIRSFRYKQVLYNRDTLIINTYFSGESIQVPIADVISIKKILSLYPSYFRMMYKIKFIYEDEEKSVLFFKSLSLYQIEDIENFLGVRQTEEDS